MELTEIARFLGVPRLPEVVADVEAEMAGLLAAADAALSEPCLRILRGRGKRLRPALVIAAASCGPHPPEYQAPDPSTVVAAAASVELMHIASLVHDDIMDRAEDRRGVPSISFREGPNTAILCGDVLFALSGQAAALVGRTAAVEAAQTIVALCNGQIREMLDNFNPARSEQAILDAIEGKTAALLRTACRLGGLCGGWGPPAVDALGEYGYAFGMAFQLVDDVLDFVSSQTVSGKPVLNDLRCGVYTLPVALAVRDGYGPELADALDPPGGPWPHTPADADAQLSDAQVEAAAAILRAGDSFSRVLDLAMDYARQAASHLSVLGDNPTTRGLAQLPTAYVERQLRTVADAGVPVNGS